MDKFGFIIDKVSVKVILLLLAYVGILFWSVK
jgi:hypothetical protein